MPPRSVRLAETALVSAFVSPGVSTAVLFGMTPPSTTPPSPVAAEQEDLLAPFLRLAVEADVELSSADVIDDVAAYRAESLYAWYVEQTEARVQMTDLEWARSRAERLRQLHEDLETMRRLEAEAMALEAAAKDR